MLLIGIYLYHFVAAAPNPDPDVAAAGIRSSAFALLAAISFAASNIMATVFQRENVLGVEGRADARRVSSSSAPALPTCGD